MHTHYTKKQEESPANTFKKDAPFVADAIMDLMFDYADTMTGMIAWRIYWRIHGLERNQGQCYIKPLTMAKAFGLIKIVKGVEQPSTVFWDAVAHGEAKGLFAHTGTKRSHFGRYWKTVLVVDGFAKDGNLIISPTTGCILYNQSNHQKASTEIHTPPQRSEHSATAETCLRTSGVTYTEADVAKCGVLKQKEINVVEKIAPAKEPSFSNGQKTGTRERAQEIAQPVAQSVEQPLPSLADIIRLAQNTPCRLLESFGAIIAWLAIGAAYSDPLNAISSAKAACASLSSNGARNAIDATNRLFPQGNSWKTLPAGCLTMFAATSARLKKLTGETPLHSPNAPSVVAGRLVGQLLAMDRSIDTPGNAGEIIFKHWLDE